MTIYSGVSTVDYRIKGEKDKIKFSQVFGVLSCHVAGTFQVLSLGSNGYIKVIVEIKYNTIFCFSGLVSAM